MREIDVLHQGVPRAICCFAIDDVIVDPGPESAHRALLDGLDGFVPRATLLTHIHFDHAGASGALARRWPSLPVYVHERGAPHMRDPAKLLASAGRLYGGYQGLLDLWGELRDYAVVSQVEQWLSLTVERELFSGKELVEFLDELDRSLISEVSV